MILPQSTPIRSMKDQPYLLEGVLTELHYDLSKENLLKRVHQHYKTQGIAASTGGALGDLFGQAANGATLAMYEGEDTQCFACLIGDQVVCGAFGGAEMLKNGEHIKAVVSCEHDVLYAHALLSPGRGLLWVQHPWGDSAERAANLKIALWCFVFQLVCIGLMSFFSDHYTPDRFMNHIAWSALVGGILSFGMALWTSSDMKTLSSVSTDIFRLLGFDKPEHVNLNKYLEHSVRIDAYDKNHQNANTHSPDMDAAVHQYKDVYNYAMAVKDKKISMRNQDT